ncbi:MAG: hypothetical protein ABSD71_07950 [Bacteroidales bacterium]|jgi:hypothetical protein
MKKVDLLQQQARKLLDYILRGDSGKSYTHAELAKEIEVERSLVTHMVNGSREIELSNIEMLEGIAGFEIFTIKNPEKLKKDESILMSEKIDKFGFFPILIQKIKSTIEGEYPKIRVETRYTNHYVSLNIFGDIVKERLHKNNLHLLFFKYIEIKGDPIFQIEYMISDTLLQSSISNLPWFTDFLKSYKPDNVSVTDFINGKAIINRNRPVYKFKELSDPEIESLADLSLAIFEIQCGLFK